MSRQAMSRQAMSRQAIPRQAIPRQAIRQQATSWQRRRSEGAPPRASTETLLDSTALVGVDPSSRSFYTRRDEARFVSSHGFSLMQSSAGVAPSRRRRLWFERRQRGMPTTEGSSGLPAMKRWKPESMSTSRMLQLREAGLDRVTISLGHSHEWRFGVRSGMRLVRALARITLNPWSRGSRRRRACLPSRRSGGGGARGAVDGAPVPAPPQSIAHVRRTVPCTRGGLHTLGGGYQSQGCKPAASER
jgi:hypothetical protein